MDQRLPDPDQPLTISVLRDGLQQLEAAGYGETPVSLYAGGVTQCLIQAHNICPDRSAAARSHSPALAFGTTWDAGTQTDSITNFVIL